MQIMGEPAGAAGGLPDDSVQDCSQNRARKARLRSQQVQAALGRAGGVQAAGGQRGVQAALASPAFHAALATSVVQGGAMNNAAFQSAMGHRRSCRGARQAAFRAEALSCARVRQRHFRAAAMMQALEGEARRSRSRHLTLRLVAVSFVSAARRLLCGRRRERRNCRRSRRRT
jgi:hypothetical protein